jgi:RNA polymerase sigma-70 factor (ECF subfamily)
MGVHVPDPVVTALDARNPTPGPEAAAELADSVGLALLVVLEALTPAERLAFVLHDTFELPFEAIAPIVDRSAVATRQLASRARRRIRELGQPAGRGPSAAGGQQLAERPVSPGRQRALVTAFLAAAREGDFDGLVRILDPEVTVRADTGGATSPFGRSREIRGAAEVARSAMAFRNLAPGAHLARVNGAPGFVVTSQGRTFAILGFAFANDRIAEVDILIDPDRLARLDVSGVVG